MANHKEIIFNNQLSLEDQLDELSVGSTFSIPRVDLIEVSGSAKVEQFRYLMLFLKHLAIDPNSEGVALSKIKSGNIMVDFFVREIADSEGLILGGEIRRGSMRLLGAATDGGIHNLRSSVVILHDETFEQIEQTFRDHYQTYNSEFDPFNLTESPRNEDMELLSIIRFV